MLATSGEDAFETVYAVAAKRRLARKLCRSRVRDRKLFARGRRAPRRMRSTTSRRSTRSSSLVPRVAKGDKGQFFTPALRRRLRHRHARRGSASSSSILRAARARSCRAGGRRRARRGADVDDRARRAVRGGGGSGDRHRGTGGLCSGRGWPTRPTSSRRTPPFAGRVDGAASPSPRSFEPRTRRPLPRARPSCCAAGGRLGIVLFTTRRARPRSRDAALARERARARRGRLPARDVSPAHVAAHVRALRAEARPAGPRPRRSARSSRSASALASDWHRRRAHLHRHRRASITTSPTSRAAVRSVPPREGFGGMKSAVRTLAELGEDPSSSRRSAVADAGSGEGVPLGELRHRPLEIAEGPRPRHDPRARDGVLDIASAIRAPSTAKSTKKAALAGTSSSRDYVRTCGRSRTCILSPWPPPGTRSPSRRSSRARPVATRPSRSSFLSAR